MVEFHGAADGNAFGQFAGRQAIEGSFPPRLIGVRPSSGAAVAKSKTALEKYPAMIGRLHCSGRDGRTPNQI
jgi:hypothetical protein